MAEQRIGIIMSGVTGRMGTNQHLIRSILAIMKQGGVRVSPELTLMPDPILVGRNEDKLRALAEAHGTDVIGKPLPRPASTFTARNPPRPQSRKLLRLPRSSRASVSRTASCRTSCGCPVSASSAH